MVTVWDLSFWLFTFLRFLACFQSKFDLIDILDKGREENIPDFGSGWCWAVCASTFRDIFRDSIISSISFAASLLPLHVCGLFLVF